MSTIDKYLRRYAEHEVSLLASFPASPNFDHCIVIPACNETSHFVTRLSASTLATNTLLILIVNQSAGATHAYTLNNNALAQHIHAYGCCWQLENLSLHKANDLHILLVDRFSQGLEIDAREGVGRARKIACDLALALSHRQQIKSHWIYSSDADAHLPENYFDAEQDGLSALAFDFTHCGENGRILRTTQLYESAIKYYRRALAWAGSPYAYHSIGSALATHTKSYAEVRGFPPRAAGEDFYLLNKLAKVGSVKQCDDITIRLDARLSDRVPFGTGPMVKKIIEDENQGKDFHYYSIEIFCLLRHLLRCLDSLSKIINSSTTLDTLFSTINNKNIEGALREQGFDAFIRHCQKQKVNAANFATHFHIWFDAFRTLKFIRFLQNTRYPAQPLEYAKKQLEERCLIT